MKNFKVYTARLDHSKVNKFKGEISADSIEEVKTQMAKPMNEGGFNLNPFYSLIIEVIDGKDKIVYNEFCQFYTGQ